MFILLPTIFSVVLLCACLIHASESIHTFMVDGTTILGYCD